MHKKADEKDTVWKYGVNFIDKKWVDTSEAFEEEQMQIRSRHEFGSGHRPGLYAGAPSHRGIETSTFHCSGSLARILASFMYVHSHKHVQIRTHIHICWVYINAKARGGKGRGRQDWTLEEEHIRRAGRDPTGVQLAEQFREVEILMGAHTGLLYDRRTYQPTQGAPKQTGFSVLHQIKAKVISHGSTERCKDFDRRTHRDDQGVKNHHHPKHVDALIKEFGLDSANIQYTSQQ